MSDWLDELSPDDRVRWDEFVDHFRREAVEMIAGSAAFISIVPSSMEQVDVKFATELGMAIMLDKPIMALAMPGAKVPQQLRALAVEVVEADIDTEEGKAEFAEALSRMPDLVRRKR